LVNENFDEAFKVIEVTGESVDRACIPDSLLLTVFERHEIRAALDSFAVKHWRRDHQFPEVMLHGQLRYMPSYRTDDNRWLYCDSMVFEAAAFDTIPR